LSGQGVQDFRDRPYADFTIFAAVISVSNISYYIGGRALYEDASLFIKPRDKIGLIGLNGKGKSTLLRLLNGDMSLDSGTISKSNDCTIGFLNQDLLSFQSDDAILTVAMEAFRQAVDTQRQIEKVLHDLEHNYSENLVDTLTRLQEKFEQLDGYTMQAKAEEVLEGIGFSTSDLHRPLREFSGGWRMRVVLAKLLLEKPSLLMLDEPTNHLDLPSIEWVEEYLRNYEGAVIVVSHDRRFLDNVTNKTVEVANQKLTTYEGNYSFYLQEKELRETIQQNAFENQQQQIRQAERFIERFRYKATKSRQVQSRIKSLERMDIIEEVVNDVQAVNFRFKFKQQSGKEVARLEGVTKAYGDQVILENTSALISRGDKIALIGANGKGKSTLLRIIAGTESIQGHCRPGYNVIPAFYAQHQLEDLHVNNEILEELKQAGSGKTEQELRNILGCFLFSDEDVFKKIKVLSGGEKSRVALAKTLISEANFLLLDEPTNHLDFISENILIQALQQFTGTFLVVSHNRHFISQIANKIWFIEDRRIKEYPGTYEEYEYWKKRTEASKPGVTPPALKPKAVSKREKSGRDEREKKRKSLEKNLERIEESLEALGARKSAIESEMARPDIYADHDRLWKVQEEFTRVEAELAKVNREWEKTAREIDGLTGDPAVGTAE
jgi:ATP-binding cassette subfamily F protein 3